MVPVGHGVVSGTQCPPVVLLAQCVSVMHIMPHAPQLAGS
jgi:hypothetical protein